MSDLIEKEAQLDPEHSKPGDDDEDSENDEHISNEYDRTDDFIADEEEEVEDEPGRKTRELDEEEESRPKKIRKLKKGKSKLESVIDDTPIPEPEKIESIEEEPEKDTALELDQEEDEERDYRRNRDDYGDFGENAQLSDAKEVFGDDFEMPVVEVPEDEDEEEESQDKFQRLKEYYEPQILASKYLTEKDEKIRLLDIPERIQSQCRENVDPNDLLLEAEWIFDIAYSNTVQSECDQKQINFDEKKLEMRQIINQVLTFILVDHYDIPFIAKYRKEVITPLTMDDLWNIYDLDAQWIQLKKKKDVEDLYKNSDLDPIYFTCLENAKTLNEVNDLAEYHQIFYGTKKHLDKFGRFKQMGVGEMVNKFGITSTQYATNLSLLYKRHDVVDCEDSPLEAASKFNFEIKGDELVRAARYMYAFQIANEPIVKQAVRNAFENHALITTTPTSKGRDCQISQYKKILNLKEEPISNFKKESGLLEFLSILRAERDDLCRVKIEIHPDVFTEALAPNACFYGADDAWNKERQLVISDVKQLLTSQTQHYIRNLYSREAKKVVATECCHILEDMILVKPLEEDIRVMVACQGFEGEMTTFVMLDEFGEYISHIQWEYSSSDKNQEQKEKLRDFVSHHEPQLVCVATCGENVAKLFKLLSFDMKLKCTYVAHDIARVYEKSQVSGEFQETLEIVKRGISVGRRYQNPLAEVSRLFNYEQEVLFVRFHFLQDMIPKDYLYEQLERQMIKTTCSIGVDLNRALVHPHLNTLTFIGGLGPRKAKMLTQKLINLEGSSIEKRSQLGENGLLGPSVFFNCIAFIHIPESKQALDNTSIHPESFSFATQMCANALDRDETKNEKIQNEYVKETMKKPQILDELDLKFFADELLNRDMGKKEMTLYDILRELQKQSDPRKLFSAPKGIELFYLLSGETPDTLPQNSVITVLVTGLSRDKAWCRLDNGCAGVISLSDISDRDISKPADVLSVGQSLEAVFSGVDDDMNALLNSKESEVARMKEPVEERSSEPKRLKYKRQKIHPLFQNITHEEAEKHLRDKDIGDLVFRPSSRGSDHIALTYKFYKQNFVTLDIKELEKKSFASVGSKLVLDKVIYEDLDEIIAKYITPIVDFIRALTKYEKFVTDSDEEKVRARLTMLKEKDPNRIPYLIGASRHTGYFYIYYMPAKKMKHERIGITVDGYVFAKRTYQNIVKMINAFKKSFQESGSNSSTTPRTTTPHSERKEW